MTEFANNVAIIKAVVAKELLKKDFTGREGDKGEKGDKGETGKNGESLVGPQGEVGKSGRDGIDGVRGPVGKSGRDGIDGKDGRDGVDGKSIEGPEGPIGKAGSDGTEGKSGRSVKSVKVNNDNMLVVTYDDGDMTIAGKVSVTNKTEVVQNGAGLPLGHFALYSATMDDDNQIVVRCNNNKTFILPTLRAVDIGGFADYNDTSTSVTPVTLLDDTWTSVPNDGEGSFTNIKLPTGVTRMLDPSTGAILLDELPIGSSVIVRMDYTVTNTTNNASLDFRYALGGGAGAYTLETTVNRLDKGSGLPYRQALVAHYIYVGDNNTRDNPVQPQVKLTGGGTFVNSGMVLEVRKAA
jgi:hypothetical protein